MTHEFSPGDRVRLAHPKPIDLHGPDALRKDEILVITARSGVSDGDPGYLFAREDGSLVCGGEYPVYESQLEPVLPAVSLFAPSWADAPAWARYLAMDSNGAWYWFEEAPVRDGTAWLPPPGGARYQGASVAGWEQSLQERPA